MYWTDFVVPGKDYEATVISAMWGRRMAMDEFEREAYEALGRRYEQIIREHVDITQSILRQFIEDYRGGSDAPR